MITMFDNVSASVFVRSSKGMISISDSLSIMLTTFTLEFVDR